MHHHHQVLTESFKRVKANVARCQAWDQQRYDRRARALPLLLGERILVRNFRRRAAGKLAARWVPRPHVLVPTWCSVSLDQMSQCTWCGLKDSALHQQPSTMSCRITLI